MTSELSKASDKRRRLRALAHQRQRTVWDGFRNLADFHSGRYECDHVSPWTKSAKNVCCEVMLVAQDWASSDYLSGPFRPDVAELGYDPAIETNVRLHSLLNRHLGLEFGDTYATNAFPLIKPGPMNARIGSRDMLRAVKEFLVPQIEIVEPRLVVCLGLQAFNSIRRTLGHRGLNLGDAIENAFTYRNSQICAVAHTGRLGTNNRGAENVEQDWARLRRLLRD